MSLLIIFVVIIIVLQLLLFIKTGLLISKLKKVLNGRFYSGTNIEDRSSWIKCEKQDSDTITSNIETSINTYLEKNKGAVSDFNLIKDIVERNCDTLEAEISSQTPLPLYLGLMGTVAGIILGLFTITVNGGFSQIGNVIEILMSDVAIAMVASFMGIGFTTLTLWNSKQCKVIVEDNKNKFYTWIQTNLLPVISRSAVSAITLLQKNLTRFNETFTDTIDRLEVKLGNVGDLYSAQIDILDKIETIDVKKMAVANVKVLSALDGSMGSLDRFSKYMESVTDYLTAVRDLNSKLDEHLERTEALATVSDFYKKQMQEIGLRQDAIKSAVVSVDDVMKSALASLQANSEEGLKAMQETFMSQMLSMQQMVGRQTEQLSSQMKQFPAVLHKLDEISSIPDKLDKLINSIEKSNSNLASQFIKASKPVPVLNREGVNTAPVSGNDTKSDKGEWSVAKKFFVIATVIIIVITCIANLVVNIKSYDAYIRSQGAPEIEETTIQEDRPILSIEGKTDANDGNADVESTPAAEDHEVTTPVAEIHETAVPAADVQ